MQMQLLYYLEFIYDYQLALNLYFVMATGSVEIHSRNARDNIMIS